MIGRMVTRMMIVPIGGFVAGVATSSFRHYYRRYAEDEDLRQKGEIQEVVINRTSSFELVDENHQVLCSEFTGYNCTHFDYSLKLFTFYLIN